MLDRIPIQDILFLDIETVPQCAEFHQLDEVMQQLWEHKSNTLRRDSQTSADVYEKAGIYAEFGKIVCISVGFVHRVGSEPMQFRLKSCFDDSEPTLLKEFSDILLRFSRQRPAMLLCAHNGKEFDFPYIARRMLINGIRLPVPLDTAGKKPWEVPFLDTMELWRFGDYKSFTPLKLLTHIFGIPSPKDDIDGSQVAGVYWKERNLPRIAKYCEKDVLATVQLMLKYMGKESIAPENVSSGSFLN